MVKKAKKYKWTQRSGHFLRLNLMWVSLGYLKRQYIDDAFISDKFFANDKVFTTVDVTHKPKKYPLSTSDIRDSENGRALSGDSGTTKPDKKE